MIDNLNYYRVFCAVVETGSISRAAERLFISQPAVSKTVTNLEKTLHVKLLNRSTKGVNLTDEGQLLYNSLRSAFDTISHAESDLTRISELGIGELKLGVSTSLCRYILLPQLKTYTAANPHINVSIDCHSTYNTIRQLQDKNVDVGFICETSLPSDFVFMPVQEVHDIFIASRDYLKHLSMREHEDEAVDNSWAFAGNITAMMSGREYEDDYIRNDTYEETDSDMDFDSTDTAVNMTGDDSDTWLCQLSTNEILEKGNLMLLEKNNITRKYLDNYFFEHGINPGQILEINNMDLLIDFAEIGIGVSAVVKEFTGDLLRRGDVVELELGEEIPPRRVGFAYHKGLSMKSPAGQFVAQVVAAEGMARLHEV